MFYHFKKLAEKISDFSRIITFFLFHNWALIISLYLPQNSSTKCLARSAFQIVSDEFFLQVALELFRCDESSVAFV